MTSLVDAVRATEDPRSWRT